MSQINSTLDEAVRLKEVLEYSLKTIDKSNTVLYRETRDTIRQFQSIERGLSDMSNFLTDNNVKLSQTNQKLYDDMAKTYASHTDEIKKLGREKERLSNEYKGGIITRQQHDILERQNEQQIHKLKSEQDKLLSDMEQFTNGKMLNGEVVDRYGRSIEKQGEVMKNYNQNLKNEREIIKGRKELEEEERKIRREERGKDVEKNYNRYVKSTANYVGNAYNNLDKDPIGTIFGGIGDISNNIGNSFGPIARVVGSVVSGIANGIGAVMKTVVDRDGAMHKMIGILGLSGQQLEAYKKKTNSVSQSMAKSWGKSLDDIVNAQVKYQEATGKSILMSEDMLNSHFAFSKIAGEENASAFSAGMEYFNYTVKDSADLYYELYKNASKMGLNTQKMTKDMVENLKLAQKYNFKGGVQNMLEMTILAQKIGMSLLTVTNVAEKIIEGGLQGAIEQAAQLQVLGGQRAYMANPLSMLHESFTNVGDLMTRITKMTEGLGRWDTKTRQMRYDNVVDEQMIRQVAKVLGITQEEIKTTRNTQMRRKEIEEHISKLGLKFSNELTESVKNKAVFNQKTQSYEVTTVSGHRIGIDQLREGDEKFLVANPEGSTIEEFAKANMSMNDTLNNSVTALKNGFGMFVYDNFGSMVMRGIDAIAGSLDWFTKEAKDHEVSGSKAVRELTIREREFARLEKANQSRNGVQLNLFSMGNQSTKYDPSMVYSEGFVEHKYRSDRESIRVAREKIMRDKANRSVRERYDSDYYSIYDANSSSVSSFEAKDSRSSFEREMLRTVSSNTTNNGAMDINMSGTIKLEGGDQSVDITETLRRNPHIMKQVAHGVVDQMGRSVNGGRSNLFPTESMRSIYR